MDNALNRDGGCFEVCEILFVLKGPRSVELLHGQLTNDIKKLAPGSANYNLLLNLKGRIEADAHVYNDQGQVLISATDFSAPRLIAHFKKYHALMGTCLDAIDRKIIHYIPRAKTGPVPSGGFAMNRFGRDGWDFIVEHEFNIEVWLQENFSGALPPIISQTLMESIRVENRIPIIGQDVHDKHLPQEANLDHALNFTKGCYLGQEIIARLHYKGSPKKCLVCIPFPHNHKLQPPQPVYFQGQEVGTATSIAPSLDRQGANALAIVPIEYAKLDALSIPH